MCLYSKWSSLVSNNKQCFAAIAKERQDREESGAKLGLDKNFLVLQ